MTLSAVKKEVRKLGVGVGVERRKGPRESLLEVEAKLC